MRLEQQRIKRLLTEAISLLCRNSLAFTEDVTVEGLLGITLDKTDILLISINETIQSAFQSTKQRTEADESPASLKRSSTTNKEPESPVSKKKRQRRGSSESSKSTDSTQVEEIVEKKQRTENSFGVKKEKQDDSDRRSINPAHDSTAKDSDTLSTLTPSPSNANHGIQSAHHTSALKLEIKEERTEEECLLIESDEDNSEDQSEDQQSWSDTHWQGMLPGVVAGQYDYRDMEAQSTAQFDQFGSVFCPPGSSVSGSMSDSMSNPASLPGTSGQPQDGQRSFSCTDCGMRFTLNHSLKRHIKVVHLKQRNHVCQICQKTFGQKMELKLHQLNKQH